MKTPQFWLQFGVKFLGVSPSLSRELWQAFTPSQTVLWQIGLIENRVGGPGNVEHFGRLVSPRDMMALCLKLAPERTGRQRRRDVIACEEAILRMTDRDGRWK